MTDFQAALLSSQLKKITAYKNRRKEIVEKYDAIFGEMPELKVQKSLSESDSCKHLYVIQIIPDKLNCNRREFFDALAAENIQPQVHYIPVYYFPYYQKKGYRKGLCPHAENMYENILSLPLYPKMTDQDVADVINAVQKVVTHFRKED